MGLHEDRRFIGIQGDDPVAILLNDTVGGEDEPLIGRPISVVHGPKDHVRGGPAAEHGRFLVEDLDELSLIADANDRVLRKGRRNGQSPIVHRKGQPILRREDHRRRLDHERIVKLFNAREAALCRGTIVLTGTVRGLGRANRRSVRPRRVLCASVVCGSSHPPKLTWNVGNDKSNLNDKDDLVPGACPV
ncbi:MAG: hypothetical protein LUO93_00715 [Methanomicrobiales archaeon]|nr:hypothetical protein [Methanomicrobiales archaeon]